RCGAPPRRDAPRRRASSRPAPSPPTRGARSPRRRRSAPGPPGRVWRPSPRTRSGSEDETPILPRHPGLDLRPARLEPGTPHEAEGELLRLLDRRLAERVDTREPYRGHGRHLEQVDELPDG